MAKESLPESYSIDNLEFFPKSVHHAFKDEEGKRFASLTVLGYAGRHKGSPAWWCQCECGQLVKAKGIQLRSGNYTSCGCKRFKRLDLPKADGAFCAADSCDRPVRARGYCGGHLARLYTTGSLERPRSLLEGDAYRFWKRVALTADPTRCWIWQGSKFRWGYGVFSWKDKNQVAHRVAWELMHGQEPKLFLLHSCDTPACVNPSHLREGTHNDNMQDAISRGRMPWQKNPLTHCKRGHAVSGENAQYFTSRGRRRKKCRICANAFSRQYKAARKKREASAHRPRNE